MLHETIQQTGDFFHSQSDGILSYFNDSCILLFIHRKEDVSGSFGGPLSAYVGADPSSDCKGRVYGGHGSCAPEKGEKAERSHVVWKGVYSCPFCRTSDAVFIPSSASFLGKQSDSRYDGSDDLRSFKLYSCIQADETGSRQAEWRITGFTG